MNFMIALPCRRTSILLLVAHILLLSNVVSFLEGPSLAEAATAAEATPNNNMYDESSRLYESLLEDLLQSSEPSKRQPRKGDVSYVVLEKILQQQGSYDDDDDDDDEEEEIVNVQDECFDAVIKACHDFNPRNRQAGKAAWKFLSQLASSSTFAQYYWHKRPVLIRAKDVIRASSDTCRSNSSPTNSTSEHPNNRQQHPPNDDSSSWLAGAFTVEKHLRMIDNSFITGFQTPASLRQMNHGADAMNNNYNTTVPSWNFEPIMWNEQRPRSKWSDFQKALQGGTIYFNSAGSLWPTLGALCRLMQFAFGLPANINVYATPANVTMSVPPHTDKQDVFVMQTTGTKHWRVYAPLSVIPPHQEPPQLQSTTLGSSSSNHHHDTLDPLDRGKHGDHVTREELGSPILDVMLYPGDILYVPVGFPHTTDTYHQNNSTKDHDIPYPVSHDPTSIHLTMGLDIQVWYLTWEHLRKALLQKSYKESTVSFPKYHSSKDAIDVAYREMIESLPIGFLGGNGWRQSWNRLVASRYPQSVKGSGRKKKTGLDPEFRRWVIQETKRRLARLEPGRWILDKEKNEEPSSSSDNSTATTNDPNITTRELMPSDNEIGVVVDYLLGEEHLIPILWTQQRFYRDVDPYDEKIGIRAFQVLQQHDDILERFATFSKNDDMMEYYRKKRLQRQAMIGR